MAEPQDRTYTTADGSELPLTVWWPEGVRSLADRAPDPKAAVVYLHGIQSHNGWYEASSRFLGEAGLAVYQVERRGSGRDAGHERGHVDRAETWLEDVHAAAERAIRETGRPRVHLLGVSWGGKLALACVAARPELYRSLVLSAPGIFPRVDVYLATKLRIGRSLLAGRDLDRFPIPLDNPHLFTENPARVRYIAEDPLSLRDVTARFLFESRRLDRLAETAAARLSAPTLLVLAGTDRIIDNERTRALVHAMSVRRRVVEYPGMHHTLEFEPAPLAYFKELAAWVEEAEAGG
jgi:alpha-beta hydrolase superfamily lysophospholipase